MITKELITLVSQAHKAELAGDLIARNTIAKQLFSKKSYRKLEHGEFTLETWYDSRSRNWITELWSSNSSSDYYLGKSDYNGSQSGAAIAHFWKLREIIGEDKLEMKESRSSNLVRDIEKLIKSARV